MAEDRAKARAGAEFSRGGHAADDRSRGNKFKGETWSAAALEFGEFAPL
jgi:hypothetical protein